MGLYRHYRSVGCRRCNSSDIIKFTQMNVDLFPSRPASPTQVLISVGHVLNTRAVHSLRAGFAYVTVAGANELIASLEQTAGWNQARKEFIVGISQGIT